MLYSEARDARAQLQSSGSRVSGISFESSKGWIFTSSQAPDSPFSAMVDAPQAALMDACTTDGDLGGNTGATSCDLYSEAKRERDSMIADGHRVSGTRFNSTIGQWEFGWEDRPTAS